MLTSHVRLITQESGAYLPKQIRPLSVLTNAGTTLHRRVRLRGIEPPRSVLDKGVPEGYVQMPPERETRPTDATKLSFPLQLVIMLLGTMLAAAATVWTIEAGLRSDIRNLNTLMTAQAETVKV